jgi:hypothetical protein
LRTDRSSCHKSARRPVRPASGFSLERFGRERHPEGQLWFCRDRATGTFGYLTRQDETDPVTVCDRVDDIASLTRLAYYAAKLIKVLSPP